MRLEPSARHGVRPVLIELFPFALLLGLTWVKVSSFNLPPRSYIENDWYKWYRADAIRAVISSWGPLLLAFAPLILLKRTLRLIGFWLLSFVVSFIVLSDFVHFRFYGDIVGLGAMSGAWQIGLIWRSVVALFKPSDLLLFADLALFLAVLPWYLRASRGFPEASKRWRRTGALALFATGVAVSLLPVSIVRADADGRFRYKYFRFFGARKIGLLNYHLYEAGQILAQRWKAGGVGSAAEREAALRFVTDWRRTATDRSSLFGVARDKNLILIMVESLQAFPIGLIVEGQEVMPNLTALARRSLYFDRFFGQTAEGTTSDGEFTSLQSLYPLSSGSVQTTFPTHTYRGLPRILSEHGYATMSAHGYFGDLWNMRQVHPRLGFQKSFFKEDYVLRESLGLGLADVEFFRQTVPRLEQMPKPFMAFLLTLSTHHDWSLPEKYRTFKVGELEGTLVGNYLQSLHHFDIGFGELLDSLRRDGLFDESIIVIFGDHKGQFGKGELEGRADLARMLTRYADWAPPDSGFDHRYWQVQNQLPLIIHLPNDVAAGTLSVTGGHLDIAPTALNLLGIEDNDMITLGRDLTRGEPEFVVFRNGSFVYADTLCFTPDASVTTAKCRDTRTRGVLDPARFSSRFDLARQRLEVSDIIIRGNLIPGTATRAAITPR